MLKKLVQWMSTLVIIFLFLTGCSQAISEKPAAADQINAEYSSMAKVPNMGGDEVLMQGFHWNSIRESSNWYNELRGKAQSMKNLGVTIVWMPPPWIDNSHWSGGGKSGGGEGYYWHNMNLNSRYGSESSFKSCLSTLKSKGLKAIVDVVPNHRNYGLQSEYVWDYGSSNKWKKNAWESGDDFTSGDADLNTGNAYHDIKGALNYVKSRVGGAVVGWRYDFVRGYPTGRVKGWNQDTGASFSVGELWKEPNDHGSLSNWARSANSCIFDFSLKKGINTGNAYNFRWGLCTSNDSFNRSAAVTFVDNHDTGYSPGQYGGQHHWPANDQFRDEAYAFICIAPGTPCLYYADVMLWGQYNLCKNALALRREAGVKANSGISFQGSNGAAGYVYGSKKTIAFSINSSWQPSGYGSPRLSGSWGKIWVK